MTEIQDRERYAPGMAVQLEAFNEALANGMPRVGWKVGINVPEILNHLKLNHSSVGWLDGNRVFSDGAQIAIPDGADIKLEPELAIHIGGTASPDVDAATARDLIRGVSPAFELVNYAQPKDGLDSIIGHAMFHYGSVLGEMQSLDAVSDMGRKWPQLTASGVECPETRADLVPDDLGGVVSFVARYLAEFDEQLKEGDFIMSGSYTATAIDLVPGIQVRGDYGELGSVSVGA